MQIQLCHATVYMAEGLVFGGILHPCLYEAPWVLVEYDPIKPAGVEWCYFYLSCELRHNGSEHCHRKDSTVGWLKLIQYERCSTAICQQFIMTSRKIQSHSFPAQPSCTSDNSRRQQAEILVHIQAYRLQSRTEGGCSQPNPDTLGATKLGSSSVLFLTDQITSRSRVHSWHTNALLQILRRLVSSLLLPRAAAPNTIYISLCLWHISGTSLIVRQHNN